MYSFVLQELKCPGCGVSLVGEGTVKVNDDVQSVNEDGRVQENIDETDLILDEKLPGITCQACTEPLDYSYNPES